MAGKVINSSLVLLSKFGASRQEITSKTATSHIRKTLEAIELDMLTYIHNFIKKFTDKKKRLSKVLIAINGLIIASLITFLFYNVPRLFFCNEMVS